MGSRVLCAAYNSTRPWGEGSEWICSLENGSTFSD
jgi:hypothetical protein